MIIFVIGILGCESFTSLFMLSFQILTWNKAHKFKEKKRQYLPNIIDGHYSAWLKAHVPPSHMNIVPFISFMFRNTTIIHSKDNSQTFMLTYNLINMENNYCFFYFILHSNKVLGFKDYQSFIVVVTKVAVDKTLDKYLIGEHYNNNGFWFQE